MATACNIGEICGTGGGNFPQPGDPDLNNTILSAQAGFGGIAVSWTYPVELAHAVSHTLLYRSKSDSFVTAALIQTLAGGYYFDQNDVSIGTTYYYWIQMVSVNGTRGDVIGPASATMQPTVEQIIDILEGQIQDSMLDFDLSTRIDRITDGTSAISDETQNRLLGDNYLTQLMEGITDDLNAVDTLIYQAELERVSGNDAVVARVDYILAQSNDNAAAILHEQAVRATDIKAVALDVQTVQASVGETDVSIQTFQLAINDLEEGMSAEWMVKTDVDGHVAGIGLYNDGVTADFTIKVDRFAVGKPGHDSAYPFIIADVNGETVIALNAKTLIPDAHITNAMIEGTIQSDDYDFWTTGWGIHKDWGGTGSLAVFHNIIARGNIEATSIKGQIIEAEHIKGGAISKVMTNVGSNLTVPTLGEKFACTITPTVPAGLTANIICMVNYQGQAVGESTTLGLRVTRSGGTIHTNGISAAKGLTNGASSSFIAENVGPNTAFSFYLGSPWTEGSISGGRIQANMMITYR
jgi:hypothetical protein